MRREKDPHENSRKLTKRDALDSSEENVPFLFFRAFREFSWESLPLIALCQREDPLRLHHVRPIEHAAIELSDAGSR